MHSTFTQPFGNSMLNFSIPDNIQLETLEPQKVKALPDPVDATKKAINMPLGTIKLEKFPKAKNIAIALNDKTRPVPHDILLPPLMEKLFELGYTKKNIKFFISSGTHEPLNKEELHKIIPSNIVNSFNIVSHNCDTDPMQDCGFSSRGTPIKVNKSFYESDLKIVIGNIEPHHFMGYSGGVKSAAIGLTSRETIKVNHSLITDKMAVAGEFFHNPMRQDVEEIGQKINVHYALNVVLNHQKEIAGVYFGDPHEVIKKSLPLVDKIFSIKVSDLYDLVITSPGGYPKDINFYQSQKALTAANAITKTEGTIILLAACDEGIGSKPYEMYMKNKHSHQQVLQTFLKQGFNIGPHKAYQVAKIANRCEVYIVSNLSVEAVKLILLKQCEPNNLQTLIDQIIFRSKENIRVAFLPMGSVSIPKFK